MKSTFPMLDRINDRFLQRHRVWKGGIKVLIVESQRSSSKESLESHTALKLENKRKMPSHLRWGPRYRFLFSSFHLQTVETI